MDKKNSILMPNGQQLPVLQALDRAIFHHQSERLVLAARIYRSILSVEPVHADAMHLLGVTERQQGNFSEAIILIKKAIKINPDTVMYYNNLSQAYYAKGDLIHARKALKKVISLDASLPEAYVNLGAIELENKEYDSAISAYKKALSIRENYIDAMMGLGDSWLKSQYFEAGLNEFQKILKLREDNIGAITRVGIALRLLNKIDEAIEYYKQAITRFPKEADLYNNLAFLYQREGNIEEASECFRELLKLTPDDVTLRHTIDSLEGSTTAVAPADYVRDLFDGYADMFESHLVEKLDYHIPEILAVAIISAINKSNDLSMLDLGCGTGLMGVELKKYCGYLIGVDLSPRIVEQARYKKIYNKLVVQDVLEFMCVQEDARYDVITAADVFVYIGNLDFIFKEVKRLLAPGGVFAFSVEKNIGNKNDYLLTETGRYSHSKEYLQKLQATHGLIEKHLSKPRIRNNFDQPVYGYVCVYGKS